MRSKFDNDMQLLNNNLIKMGALCEHTISLAINCFSTSSDITVDMVKANEIKIDEYENEIERQCLKLLLQQQPVAKDLRIISAAMKMITDLERIGDQALDIAELSNYTKEINLNVKRMAEKSINMLTSAINAFVNEDLELAKDTVKHDDIVDDLFLTVRCDIIKTLKSEQFNAQKLLDMLMIAKYLERIADHAVNLSEGVIFAITGLHKGDQL